MFKNDNIAIFNDTLNIARNTYPILELNSYINLLSMSDISKFNKFKFRNFDVILTDGDCIENIPSNNNNNGILVNSASLKKPGGGVTTGSNAQEENYCRRSNLYLYLEQIDKDLLFPIHGKTVGQYLPNVSFFKDENYNLYDNDKIITTNIVNLFSRPYEKLKENSYRHHLDCFKVLAHFSNTYNAKYIVMPLIGCGVFGNNPDEVSKALYTVLTNVQLKSVEKIILCAPKLENYKALEYAFRKELSN